MAFARLFFHAPRFAVLDECTNGIAPAVEKDLFDQCHKLGMGVFSISHKEGLKAVCCHTTLHWVVCSAQRGSQYIYSRCLLTIDNFYKVGSWS